MHIEYLLSLRRDIQPRVLPDITSRLSAPCRDDTGAAAEIRQLYSAVWSGIPGLHTEGVSS
jgi:hypothetical protein